MKSRLLAAIVVAIIIAQLFASASLIQVKGDTITASTPNSNCQSQSGGNNIISCLQSFCDINNYFQDFCNFFDNCNRHHQSTVDYIVVSPQTATIAAGQSQTYTATAYNRCGNSWDVTNSPSTVWSINSGAGTYTWTGSSVQVTKAGDWTVTATYRCKSATACLTVTHAGTDKLSYITASVYPTTVAAPNTVTGTATAYDIYGNSWDVSTLATWSIPAGNDGGSWTQNVYTSHTAGTYTVQAAYDGKTATAQLIVTHSTNPAYLARLLIAPQTATVNAGVSQSYTATAYDTFGNSWTVTATYTCPSSNVVVSGSSVYSNTDGTYTITGAYSGLSDNATLIVIGHLATIISITVLPQTATISAGLSQAFTATASDGYNTWDVTDQATWSINATAGGSWSQSTGTYTSAIAGMWTVQATMNGVSGSANLTVNANSASVGYIVISPKTATVSAGTPQSYNVTAYDQYGNSLGDVTSSSTFSAPGASVTGNSVTADSAGSYNVTATYDGLTDNATLTVTGTTVSTSYTVTFTESGLQSGTSWGITFDGQAYTSTTDNIIINNLSAQSYPWSTPDEITLSSTQFLTTQTSGTLLVPTQLTQNIQYTTQYLVTYSATGNVLSVTVPASQWVNAGGQATGSFPAQVINGASNTRCNFISDNRPAAITQPTTITGTYQTQYYLTVTSPYGNPSGEGWYDSGALATASLSSADVSGGSGTQHAFESWSGDASGTALTSSIFMTGPETAIASWSMQYLVTYSVTGNVLSITAPANEWVTAGSAAQGKFVSEVTNTDDNTECLFLSDNRTQSITAPTTITGQYQSLYKVTFSQTGIASDAKGTIVTVSGSSEDYANLPNITWVDGGTTLTFSFTATVASTSANKQYSLTKVNATSPVVINSPMSIQGSYKTLHSISLYIILEFALIIFAILLAAFSLERYRRDRQKRIRNASETANPAI